MANITPTQMQVLLVMLENNLELMFDFMDADSKAAKELELEQYIRSAAEYIEVEGITLDLDKINDQMLVVMYASWIYDKRKDGVAIMPRMLRYNLNNRLFKQKVV